MVFDTPKEKGRAGLLAGMSYFGSNGYTISLPINDTQWYDFVIEKDGAFYTVQCKATASTDLHLYRNTKAKAKIYSIFDNHVDYLFCLDGDQNKYCIPVLDIRKAGNVRSIRLSPVEMDSKRMFPTWEYIVAI